MGKRRKQRFWGCSIKCVQREHDLTIPYFQGNTMYSQTLCRNVCKAGNTQRAQASCIPCAHFLVRIGNALCISCFCLDLPTIKAESAFRLMFSFLIFSVYETWIFRQYRSLFLTEEANTSDWYPYFNGKKSLKWIGDGWNYSPCCHSAKAGHPIERLAIYQKHKNVNTAIPKLCNLF